MACRVGPHEVAPSTQEPNFRSIQLVLDHECPVHEIVDGALVLVGRGHGRAVGAEGPFLAGRLEIGAAPHRVARFHERGWVLEPRARRGRTRIADELRLLSARLDAWRKRTRTIWRTLEARSTIEAKWRGQRGTICWETNRMHCVGRLPLVSDFVAGNEIQLLWQHFEDVRVPVGGT